MPETKYKMTGKELGGLIVAYLGAPSPCEVMISVHPNTGDVSMTIITPDLPPPAESEPEPPPTRPPKVLPPIPAAKMKQF